MANENERQIKERIKSLLAKASDTGASEEEAASAMAMARKLMEKFSLSEEDLKTVTADAFKRYTINGKKVVKPKQGPLWGFHIVDKYTAKALSEFCGIKAYYEDLPEGRVIHYFGLESDVEFALWLRQALIQQFESDWETFKRFKLGSRRLLDIKDARKSFGHGFARAVNDRVSKWLSEENKDRAKNATQGTALVVSKKKAVESELASQGIHLSPVRRAGDAGSNRDASGAGYNSGSAASMGRGVGGSGRIMIGN